jgi:hypothetical protein
MPRYLHIGTHTDEPYRNVSWPEWLAEVYGQSFLANSAVTYHQQVRLLRSNARHLSSEGTQ